MKNVTLLTEALSLDGLDNTCEMELAMLSQELGLEALAISAAKPHNRSAELLPAIGKAASLLAIRRAILRYKPDGKVCTLPNYLKHFTTLWARRLAGNGELGKAFPQVDLSTVVAEAYGKRIYEEVVKAGPPPEATVEEDEQMTNNTDDCQFGNQALGVVKTVLEQNHISWTEETSTIHMTINCNGAVCSLWFKLIGPDLSLSVNLPIFAHDTFRGRMPEVLNVINWKLLVGNFEMDPEDGEIRFRATMPLHGTLPTESQVDCLLKGGVYAVRQYGLALIEAGLTDHDTGFLIARAEKNFQNHEEQ